MSADSHLPTPVPGSITTAGRYIILLTAFLGWLCAGMQMSITSVAMRSAAKDLLSQTGSIDREKFNELSAASKQQTPDATSGDTQTEDKKQLEGWRGIIARWFAWYLCAFLFGAAAGGLIFGKMGDRIGRSKAMAASILCYSLVSGAAYFAQTPMQLLVLRFVACMGVGGMWPNGVALVSEAWANMSRPMVSGVIGTAANVGIFLLATIAAYIPVTDLDWRWVMLVGASPALLGLIALFAVPESPRWLAARNGKADSDDATKTAPASGVFSSPFLKVTLVGILLATVPLMGGWGSANWMIPWAGEAGEAADPQNPFLKAHVVMARSLTGIVGSLLGGWIGSFIGRRTAYFIVSLAALFCAQYAFWFTIPTDEAFLYWVGALGFFSGIYFGWLPLFLPELFPTRVRATGAGVSFNFGRILTATTIVATGALMQYFAGDYAKIGRLTSLIYLVGAVIIWFAPDTSRRQLED